MLPTYRSEDGRGTLGVVRIELDVEEFLSLLVLRADVFLVLLKQERSTQPGEIPLAWLGHG